MVCVLIVDDDAGTRDVLRAMLEGAGYEVVEARNGREGLQRYQEAAPHVVILDLFMPEQDGLETIVALRRVSPTVKIIAISGGGQTGLRDFLDIARQLGAQHTMYKPIHRQELLEAVSRLVGSADTSTP